MGRKVLLVSVVQPGLQVLVFQGQLGGTAKRENLVQKVQQPLIP